jgi:hypothetical protein
MSIVKVKGKKDARAEQETAAQREQEEKLRRRALCMAVLRAMAMLRYGDVALSAVLQPYIAIARTLSWANRNVRRHRERKGCQQHRLSDYPHVLNKSKLCGGLDKRRSAKFRHVLIHSGSAARPLKISTHSSLDILFLPSGGTDTFRVYMKRRVSSRHRALGRGARQSLGASKCLGSVCLGLDAWMEARGGRVSSLDGQYSRESLV